MIPRTNTVSNSVGLLLVLMISVLFSSSSIVVEGLSHPPTNAATTATTCAAPSPAFGLFDVITTKLRGGEVHDGSASDDVDALILKAGSNSQLVVIDFTATWYVFTRVIPYLYKKRVDD